MLSVTNTSDYVNATYKWYKDSVEVQSGASSVLTVTAAGHYMVYVYDSACGGVSAVIDVTQSASSITTPVIASATSSYVLCGTNSSILLTVTNDSVYTSPTYQWYRNDTLISGATQRMYIVTQAGDYHVVVIDGICGTMSSKRTITDNASGATIQQPIVTIAPPSQTLCGVGSVVALRVVNTSDYSSNATYIWYNGVTEVQRSTSPLYFAGAVGEYRVLVSEIGGCSALSDTTNVIMSATDTIKTPIVMKNQNITNLCDATTAVLLTVTNASQYSPTAEYIWYNGVTEVQRSTGANAHIYSVHTAGDYYVVVIDGNCASKSNTQSFTQQAPPLTQDPCIGCNDCDPATEEISCATIGTPIVLVNTVNNTYLHTGIKWNITAASDALPLTFDYILTGATTGAGNSLDSVEFNVGVTTVTWTVTNAYNVSATCAFNVIVLDHVPCIGCDDGDSTTTEISCATIGDQTLYADAGASTYTHIDNSWDITAISTSPITHKAYKLTGATIKPYNNANTTLSAQAFNIGLTEVMWYVTDSMGHKDSCSFNVTVWDNYPCIGCDDNDSTTTEISCDDIINTVFCADTSGVYTHLGNDWNITATDHRGIDTIFYTLTGATTGSGSSLDSIIFNVGTTHVKWRAVNVIGLYKECTFDVIVNALPQITTLTPEYACEGSTVPSIALTGTPTSATFAWKHIAGTDTLIGLPLNGFGNMPSFLAVNNDTVAKHARYLIEATNSGAVTCKAADTLDIYIAPKPVVNPISDVTLCNNDSLHVAFSGSANTYHWTRVSSTNVGLPFSGTGDMNYQVNNALSTVATVTYKVQAVYTFPYSTCNGDEEQFNIIVQPSLHLSSAKEMGLMCSDVFEYQATSLVSNVTYHWTRDAIDSLNGYQPASGTGASITEMLNNESTDTIDVIYKIVLEYNGCYSDTEFVHVAVLPSAGFEMDYLQTVCEGELTLNINFTNHLGTDYLIVYDNDALMGGFVNSNSYQGLPTTGVISIALPGGIKPGTYHAQINVKTAEGCIKSTPFVINVKEKTRIIQQPESVTSLCVGISTFTLTVKATGSNLTYQWYLNGNPIIGATSDEFTQLFDTIWEGVYYVEVTGDCQTIASNVVEVKRNDLTMDEKWDDVLYVNNYNSHYVRYQWYKDGVAVTGQEGTGQYYTEKTGLVGEYFVRAYHQDGTYVESCPVTYNRPMAVSAYSVYPNPVESASRFSVLAVEDGKPLENAYIEVYSILGQQLNRIPVKGKITQLDAPYATGSYIVKIVKSDGSSVIKSIVVK
jgi:hypothetical protein